MKAIPKTELLTCAEVGDLLKVSRTTVVNMIHQGIFKGKKVGLARTSSPWRIYKDSVDDYLAQADDPTV